MERREQSLDALQDRVMKVKECAKLQKTPLQMQVRNKKNNLKSTNIIAAKYPFTTTRSL